MRGQNVAGADLFCGLKKKLVPGITRGLLKIVSGRPVPFPVCKFELMFRRQFANIFKIRKTVVTKLMIEMSDDDPEIKFLTLSKIVDGK